MLDGRLKRVVDPALDYLGGELHAKGIKANSVTLIGLVLGLAAAAIIACGGSLWLSILVFGLSRVADGLDGVVARRSGMTEFGAYLDIVCDFIVYAAIPLAMVLRDPSANALASAVLLASFYINGATLLAFAALASRRGLVTEIRGPKGLYFSAGLAEASETIAAFVLFLIFPHLFSHIAYIFAAACLITAASRTTLLRRILG